MSVFVSDPSENIKNTWIVKYGLGLVSGKTDNLLKTVSTCSNTYGGLLS